MALDLSDDEFIAALRNDIDDTSKLISGVFGNDPDNTLNNAILRLLGLFGSLLGSIQALGLPITTLVERQAWTTTPVNKPDPDKLIAANFRKVLTDEQFIAEMREYGFNDQWSRVLSNTFEQLINVGELFQLFWRGEISEQSLQDRLEAHGLNTGDALLVMQLTERIPPISDLISMSVRDVFDAEAVSLGRLFDNLPQEFVKWGQTQGFSRDWLEKYWGAHWRIPSALRGFEMLHRGVIDDAELDILLRALDIAPGWRDKMKAISFKVVGRVDTRRFYAMGVWDRDQVKRSYLDQGFDEQTAEWQTWRSPARQDQKSRRFPSSAVLERRNGLRCDSSQAVL